MLTPSSPTFAKTSPITANTPPPNSSGGAKKVNVEVIMKSNPFRVEENEKTTRMELIRSNYNEANGMLRFTYYVKPECEAKKFRDTSTELFDSNGRLTVFTNDFFTIYQDSATGEMNISLNEIVQTVEEQRRTEALGEKLFTLLKDRPRHRALLTNECKLNHSFMNAQQDGANKSDYSGMNGNNNNNQEDETYYTRELIHIYGQPIVPSFHKYFNYQLSNTHYGYRTLRRLLNCDILKKYVKITKEEIKSLDRVVEFVQLTHDKCLLAFQLNMTSFYDPIRFENGIVKNWLDVWYVDRLKEKYALNESSINKDFLCTSTTTTTTSSSSTMSYSLPTTFGTMSSSSWSMAPQQYTNETTSCFLHTTNCDHVESECDQANHLWFCLQDYTCLKMEDFMHKIRDYILIRNNKSELILVHTAHPVFEYKDVLAETRRILAMFLSKSSCNKTLDEIIGNQLPKVAKEHVETLLVKFLNIDEEKKIVGFSALFEILMILKRELAKEKNDEMKYSHFLCTLERANQEKLKLAIVQLKCVPCLNKFTTNFNIINTPGGQASSLMSSSSGQMSSSPSSSNLNSSTSSANNGAGKNVVSHANMSRLLKQMSLIVSTELQQIAIDVFEKMEEDKLVKYIKLKEEFRHSSAHLQQHQQQISQSSKPVSSSSSSSSTSSSSSSSNTSTQSSTQSQTKSQPIPVQTTSKKQINERQLRSLTANFNKQMDITNSNSSTTTTTSSSSSGRLPIFNPNNLLQYFNADQKTQELSMDRTNTSNNLMYSDRL